MATDEKDQEVGIEEEEAPVVTQAEYVRETLTSEALVSAIPGVILLMIVGVMMFYQQKQNRTIDPISYVLAVIALGIVGYGISRGSRARRVVGVKLECPFCQTMNELTAHPDDDFRCTHCNREVPILDGNILPVFQVRCGYCNHLNYYSEKSTGLICEECDRAIPLATGDQSPVKKTLEAFTVHDDNQPYDLVLETAPKSEEMISTLQQMLALNRNQVKDLLEDLPQVLLTGIPKKKAELLSAQISVHKGSASTKVSQG